MTESMGEGSATKEPLRAGREAGMFPPAIQTAGLSKRFGHQLAVDGINLSVPQGSVFGFLGPNGSGKTTTIRMLLGLASATSGSISLLGHGMPAGLHDVLPRVGALVEGPAFYPFLSGAANLHRLDTANRQASRLTRRARVHEALERVGLSHAAHKKVRAYSLGMKQRLGIAHALLSPRELLVLDEPTNGLDPQGTREVRSLVRTLAAGGATVFISSHLLAEVEQICTHAAIMRTGRLVAQGTLAELRRAGRPLLRVVTPDPGTAAGVLVRLGLIPVPLPGNGRDAVLTATLPDSGPEGPGLLPETVAEALVKAGVRLRGFTVEGRNLEERYVELTGEGFEIDQ